MKNSWHSDWQKCIIFSVYYFLFTTGENATFSTYMYVFNAELPNINHILNVLTFFTNIK